MDCCLSSSECSTTLSNASSDCSSASYSFSSRCDRQISSTSDVFAGNNEEDAAMDFTALRGWSMRHGHLKKLQRPKMGKAAIWAEIQGQGRQVSKGRSVFKRSVNNGQRNDWKRLDLYERPSRKKAQRREILRQTIDSDACAFCEDCNWDDLCSRWSENGDEFDDAEDEDWSEWSQVDGCWGVGSKELVKQSSKLRDYRLYCARLASVGTSFQPSLLESPVQPFEKLQKEFLLQNGREFCRQISNCTGRAIRLKPAPVSKDVQSRFIEACAGLSGVLRPCYHGTHVDNLPSIYEKGLLIPGQGNEVRVANGQAHGLGVYTAKVEDPLLSWEFCKANSKDARKMLVCGLLDDASKNSSEYTIGIRTVTSESENVRHVGNAMVIFDHRRVASLFELTIDAEKTKKSVIFNWAHHEYLLQRVSDEASPEKARRHRIHRRKGCCSGERLKTPEDFLARRGAKKRRLNGR